MVARQVAVAVAVVAVESEPTAAPPTTTEGRVRPALIRWLAALPLRWWLTIGVALLIAASAVFGGLAEATEVRNGPVILEPGQEFVGPELTTTVTSAEITDVAPGLTLEPDEGNTYVVVEATVTNTWRVSSITFGDLLQLPWLGEEWQVAERTVLLSDGTIGVQVNPDVPVEVAFVWEIPRELVPTDGVIPVTIMAKSLTEDGLVTYGSYWSSPEPAALVTLEAAQ